MNKLPDAFPVLSTERLTLAPVSMAMLEDIFFIFNDPKVVRFYPVAPLANRGKAMERIQQYQRMFREKTGIRWVIIAKGTHSVVGTIGINSMDSNNKCSISYDLSSNWWKRGYMQEAMQAFLAYVFGTLEINRVQAEVMKDNTDSCVLLEKLGFEKEGLLREWQYWDGRYNDIYMYALLRREYKAEDHTLGV
ncbi:ribosomal-protein-alanine N-acetyltransferase [Chitinophaga dinghuensis]|uniref:Ribosomal-protein-alanine N-acetyltransferase n=1 Tax=Chitinophaga dinghuensis TaxID=1539050 RepID=A0A327W5D2_9BACT|nr:GNAT family protein [Chitinophaga dinghuensis]RAJ83586.1 ribosomal-protein-alanine N-acetyltransferase [Chitinophaga dinghuensis]